MLNLHAYFVLISYWWTFGHICYILRIIYIKTWLLNCQVFELDYCVIIGIIHRTFSLSLDFQLELLGLELRKCSILSVMEFGIFFEMLLWNGQLVYCWNMPFGTIGRDMLFCCFHRMKRKSQRCMCNISFRLIKFRDMTEACRKNLVYKCEPRICQIIFQKKFDKCTVEVFRVSFTRISKKL